MERIDKGPPVLTQGELVRPGIGVNTPLQQGQVDDPALSHSGGLLGHQSKGGAGCVWGADVLPQQHGAVARIPPLLNYKGHDALRQPRHGLLIGLEGPVKVLPGKGPLGDEVVGQGGVRPLQLGGEGGGGDIHSVGPEEGLPVHPLGHNTAVLSQGPGVVPGKVGAVGVAQGPEHEGHVHGPGGGVSGTEGGVRGTLGKALVIGIGHIAVRPGGHVGEGVGLPHLRRFCTLAQSPDQHGYRLLPAGCPVQVEVGEAVFILPHTQEEAQLLQTHGLALLTAQVPTLRRPGGAQAQRKAQQSAQYRQHCFFHRIRLLIFSCHLVPVSRRSPPSKAGRPRSPRR